MMNHITRSKSQIFPMNRMYFIVHRRAVVVTALYYMKFQKLCSKGSSEHNEYFDHKQRYVWPSA